MLKEAYVFLCVNWFWAYALVGVALCVLAVMILGCIASESIRESLFGDSSNFDLMIMLCFAACIFVGFAILWLPILAIIGIVAICENINFWHWVKRCMGMTQRLSVYCSGIG